MKQVTLVTGGSGFIGSALIRHLVNNNHDQILNLDAQTYAGDIERLPIDSAIQTIEGDICDRKLVPQLFNNYKPTRVFHFAAESHVDRSIDGPEAFIKTNVEGTLNLLQCANHYWQKLRKPHQDSFRFIHISTDEVYGALGFEDKPFTETSSYKPSSPYAASKAASDHLVYSWWKTFNLPTIMTHCSNNYGPWQFPEKLIPLMISKALREDFLPVYGNGSNIRDWIFVDDHVRAILKIAKHSNPGERWNIGSECEISNLDLVNYLCDYLDQERPRPTGVSYRKLIKFVTNRPGHDLRYALNIDKLKYEFKWEPQVSFDQGLLQTIDWNLQNQDWIQRTIARGNYTKQSRLGLANRKE